MKKKVIWMTVGLVALLASMLIAVCAAPFGLPSQELIVGTAQQDDGTVVVAENRAATSRIYFLRDGIISSIYRESRLYDGEERSIARLVAEGANVYFVRVLSDGYRWELVQQTGTKTQVLCQSTFEDELTVSGLMIRKGVVWVTGITASGVSYVYEYQPAKKEVVLKLVTPAWWVQDVETAEFDGSKFWITTHQGEKYIMSPDGEVKYAPITEEQAVPVVGVRGSGWLLCKQMFLIAAAVVWLVIAISVLAAYYIARRSERLAVRLTVIESEILFLILLAGILAVSYVLVNHTPLVQALRAAGMFALSGLLVCLIMLAFLRVLTGYMMRSITTMTQQMSRIAAGDTSTRDVTMGKDELNRMNRAMQEMCISITNQNYEVNNTLLSYKRFVPQKLPTLLDRNSVAEVSLGDNRRVEGNIGLFSVGNRNEARNLLDDTGFVHFLNYTFNIVQDCVQENQGSMVSNALELAAMETIFPDNAAHGVRAGLDVLGRTQKITETNIPQPQPLLILHRTSFLYGVTGREDRLFSYIFCRELEFLSSFSPYFQEYNTRIVVTETYWKQLKNAGFTVRYIGFLSDGEEKAIKLYEVLDAYPELERKLRAGYDQRFQEALNRFYHNDFFLARNLFSTLLRVCPEDGIAKWYLFACEYFFNRDGEDMIDYQLFGVKDR